METNNFKNLILVQVFLTVVVIAVSIQASPHGREIKGINNNAVGSDLSLSSESESGGHGQGQGQEYNDTDISSDYVDILPNLTTKRKQFQIQIKHVINPGFQNWRENEMQKNRNPSKSIQKGSSSSGNSNNHSNRRRRHVNLNTSFSYSLKFPTSITNIDVVVIGTRTDVLEAFKGELMQYGTNNQALLWSSRRFHTFILQKSGKRPVIFECGEMYIAGRLLNGYPTYVHDFYPTQVRNPLGGNLRFPISQRCNKIS